MRALTIPIVPPELQRAREIYRERLAIWRQSDEYQRQMEEVDERYS